MKYQADLSIKKLIGRFCYVDRKTTKAKTDRRNHLYSIIDINIEMLKALFYTGVFIKSIEKITLETKLIMKQYLTRRYCLCFEEQFLQYSYRSKLFKGVDLPSYFKRKILHTLNRKFVRTHVVQIV